MKVTLRQLLTGINLNLADCLEMEYRISQHCVEAQKDFYEGVRAGKELLVCTYRICTGLKST